MPQLPTTTTDNAGPLAHLCGQGTIARAPYLAAGLGLLTLKYGIDLSIAELIFHRHWQIWNYIFPGQSLDFLALTAADRDFFIILISLSLPFIWAGTVLTMKRLRSAGLPAFLVKLFFVPLINAIMFSILCILPEHETVSQQANVRQNTDNPQLPDWPKPDRKKAGTLVYLLDSSRTNNYKSDALFALLLTVPPGLFAIWLGTIFLQSYGWGLFLGVPFAVGMSSAYLFGIKQSKSALACQMIAALSTAFLGLSIFLWAWEGAICLLMAAPIAFVLAAMGALLGYYLQRNKYPLVEQKLLMLTMLLCVPTLMGAEYASHPVAPLIAVISTVDIAAPPQTAWRNVISFPQLPAPNDPIFRIGLAYPIGATISGTGVGAVRRCRFSTGAFVEPITAWQPPQLLRFGVESQPPTMREWSWMHEIHPAHLQGFLLVKNGQFKLSPTIIKDSKLKGTRLEGTTWYQNRMWPNFYWSLWSNTIIHRIHMRVLNHIKQISESG